MNPFSEIARRYKWLRHGRGFGVHSPWAYRIIMDVLREKAQYYPYPAINRNFGDRARVARALFRLMVFLRPARVYCSGNSPWASLRDLACPAGNGPAMMVIDDESTPIDVPDSVETVVFVSLHQPGPRALWSSMLRSRGRGLAIDTHNGIGIICLRPDLPRQLIDAYVRFP